MGMSLSVNANVWIEIGILMSFYGVERFWYSCLSRSCACRISNNEIFLDKLKRLFWFPFAFWLRFILPYSRKHWRDILQFDKSRPRHPAIVSGKMPLEPIDRPNDRFIIIIHSSFWLESNSESIDLQKKNSPSIVG